MEKSKEFAEINRASEQSARTAPAAALGERVQALLAQPRLVLNPVLLLIFSTAWLREVLYWLPTDAFGTSLNYWAYTDWLINYSQGFIRRGLAGELWRLIPPAVPPLQAIAVLSWVLILAAVFGYVRLLARSWKTYHPLTLFGLLFLPSLFVFYMHDHNAIARKEILGYVTLLLHLFIIEKSFPLGDGAAIPVGNLRRYLTWQALVAVIFLPAIVLIHEGNFLMFAPLHAMITLSILQAEARRGLLKAALWTGLLYLPAAAAFIAVYLSGTPTYQTLLEICKPLAAAGALRESTCYLPPDKLSGSTLPGGFIPMQWSLAQAADITRMIISMNWEAWILVLPALGVSLWYLVRQALYSILRARSSRTFDPRAARRYQGLFFRRYFLVPLLVSLPVYFTAYDYGRWFTVTCVNFALLAVSLNLPSREFALRQNEGGEDALPADSPEHLDHRWVFYGVSIVICVLALVLWLPHYCLFRCDVLQSPLQFFSHAFNAQ